MSSANVEVVRGLYAAIGRGDIAAFTGGMAPDIVWNEAENFPYDDANPYRGPDAIMSGVFARIVADWDGFAATPEEVLDAGDAVVSLGRYTGACKATGKPLNAQFVHVWRIAGGKAVGFQQYADTLGTAIAMGR